MHQGEINPSYKKYYDKAHAERAAAFENVFNWLIGRRDKR